VWKLKGKQAMSLVVEDGTGKSNSESFCSVADADTYHSNYGNTTWASQTTADKEVALRKATQYLCHRYVHAWQGVKTEIDQALEWPRVGVVDGSGFHVDYDEIPQKVRDATSVLALSALSESLYTDESTPGRIKRTRSKVDVLEDETEYMGGSLQQKQYTLAHELIKEFLASLHKLSRA
jgi:hypothetical protein